MDNQIIVIKTSYITLGQLLKFIGLISNGSEAKMFLTKNEIIVNDILENRRGRKLYKNDKIRLSNKTYIIN